MTTSINQSTIRITRRYRAPISFTVNQKTEEYLNFFTPKLSLRFSPNDMKDYSDSERNINTDNIFANNRIGLDDTLESGDPLLLD